MMSYVRIRAIEVQNEKENLPMSSVHLKKRLKKEFEI